MTRRQFLGAAAAIGAFPNVLLSAGRSLLPGGQPESDRIELVVPGTDRFRILQITDTHFGNSGGVMEALDRETLRLIRQLVDEHRPNLVFHTGDFVNNDRENPRFDAVDALAGMGVPWTFVFGNHDHPNGKSGQKSLEEFRRSAQGALVGYADLSAGRRHCFRIDLRREGSEPFASLLAFNTGDPQSGMKIDAAQAGWFEDQIEADRRRGRSQPLLVFQHIPTIEYHELYTSGQAVGRQGEKVCYELDRGETFARYRSSGRVRAVFVGHDHVNDYLGDWEGTTLVYGRCTGYAGYGDWARGARLIDIDPQTGHGSTRVVLLKNHRDRAEWTRTHEPRPLARAAGAPR